VTHNLSSEGKCFLSEIVFEYTVPNYPELSPNYPELSPRTFEPEPEPVATAAPSNQPAKANWNLDPDGPRTTNAATEEKRPRLSPEERAAQVEFIRSLNK